MYWSPLCRCWLERSTATWTCTATRSTRSAASVPVGWIDSFTSLDVRRAFTVFQLMTILEENHHSFLIVEHDPLLYEDAGKMVEYLAQALKQTSREATILLYALADRVFCIYSEQAPAKGRKAEAKMPPRAQATLEAYS